VIKPSISNLDIGIYTVTWANVTPQDFCESLHILSGCNPRSVQVTGVFSGAQVGILGSNNNEDFVVLRDYQGIVLTFTAKGLRSIQDQVVSIKPVISGKDYNITITMLMTRST
jgi:hypothetical protein